MGFFDFVARLAGEQATVVQAIASGDQAAVKAAAAAQAADPAAVAVNEHPLAVLKVAGGTVLVATGVGAATGAGLIASGGLELANALQGPALGGTELPARELTTAEKDDPKVKGGLQSKVDASRGRARGFTGGRQQPQQQAAPPPSVPTRAPSFWEDLVLGIEDLLGGRR